MSTTQTIRQQIRAAMKIDGMSQRKLAAHLGIDQPSLNRYLSGDKAAEIEQKIGPWAEKILAEAGASTGANATTASASEAATPRTPLRRPAVPSYQATPTAERVMTTLTYAHLHSDVAVIYGGAGLGKSIAARQYQRDMDAQGEAVWVATMSPASSAVVPALQEIAEAIGAGEAAGGGAAKVFRLICRRVRESGGLLVIDEAQHLSLQAMDQIRAIHDETGIGLVFMGNEAVYSRMTGGTRAAYLDRIYSRIGKRTKLVRATHGDVDVLLAAWDIPAENLKPVRTLAREIAGKAGGLRVMTKALRLATQYAQAAGRGLAAEDVRAAWHELGWVE